VHPGDHGLRHHELQPDVESEQGRFRPDGGAGESIQYRNDRNAENADMTTLVKIHESEIFGGLVARWLAYDPETYLGAQVGKWPDGFQIYAMADGVKSFLTGTQVALVNGKEYSLRFLAVTNGEGTLDLFAELTDPSIPASVATLSLEKRRASLAEKQLAPIQLDQMDDDVRCRVAFGVDKHRKTGDQIGIGQRARAGHASRISRRFSRPGAAPGRARARRDAIEVVREPKREPRVRIGPHGAATQRAVTQPLACACTTTSNSDGDG
jgi:hypothetical protein